MSAWRRQCFGHLPSSRNRTNIGGDADIYNDEDEEEDVEENEDDIYSASTVSYEDADEDDHSSLSSIDFDRFDFAPILADLELIRQNGRMRNTTTGSYHSVDSSWRFTESQIRGAVRHYPDSFLREYFVGTFPNFH